MIIMAHLIMLLIASTELKQGAGEMGSCSPSPSPLTRATRLPLFFRGGLPEHSRRSLPGSWPQSSGACGGAAPPARRPIGEGSRFAP